MNKNRIFVNSCLHIVGLIFCVVPPAVCTLCYFPLWKEAGGEAVIAGGCALLLVLSAIPLMRVIRGRLKSPASYTLWLLAFLLFFGAAQIAEEMTVISFVGFVGNLIGALLFKLGGKRDEKRS